MTSEKEIKNKIVNIISTLLPETKIILYGSRARGTHQEISDYDIALDSGNPIDYNKFVEFCNVVDGLTIPQKIDLVDLQVVSEKLRKHIMQDGVVWKQ